MLGLVCNCLKMDLMDMRLLFAARQTPCPKVSTSAWLVLDKLVNVSNF